MISVCLACYNGEKYIKRQIDSILSQLSSNDELVISDDGSVDQTIFIAESYSYKDSRVRIIRNSGKKGVVGNFENALKSACGDIIFLSDQDDIWLPNKVDVLMSALKVSDVVFSNIRIVDECEQVVKERFFKTNNNCGFWRNILSNHYFGATMAFKKTVLQKALPFPAYIPMHDQWIGLIGEKYFRTVYFEEPLILYRRHGANASYAGEKSKNSFLKKISFRVKIMFAIMFR